jgi:hypothetical protein
VALEKSKKKSRTRSAFSVHKFSWVFLACFILVPVALLVFTFFNNNLTLPTVKLSLIAFLVGKILELRRISEEWKNVGKNILYSALLSLIVLLPFKGEQEYILQNHINLLPISFVIIFTIGVLIDQYDRLKVRIGEGVTLLHSLTLLYFFAELFREFSVSSWWLGLVAIPVIYSLVHALTYIEITSEDRLYLSIWSSLTMFVFGFVYVQSVLSMGDIEKSIQQNRLWEGSYVFLEYFLLGASGAYILQNASMLLGYFPDKNFIGSYKKQVKALNQEHIDRFSSEQVDRIEAWFVLLLVGGVLISNYFLKFFESQFMIFLCLIIGPFLVGLFSRTIRPKLKVG